MEELKFYAEEFVTFTFDSLSCVGLTLRELSLCSSPRILEAPCLYDIQFMVVVKKLLLFPVTLGRHSKGNVYILLPVLVASKMVCLDRQSTIVC